MDHSRGNAFFQGSLTEWILENMKGKSSTNSVFMLPWEYVFIIAIWSFWRERNNIIFNGKNRSLEQIKFGIIHQVEEIIRCNEKMSKVGVSKIETLIDWTFPTEGWVKCNVDGAC